VERAGQLLPREDPDVAEEITKILREDEVDVLLNAAAKRVEGGVDGRLTLTVTTAGAADRQFVGSHLPVAAGRAPNTDDLNLRLPASAPTGRATSWWTAG
jgi:pyruvate/2-oxoglutarate dehydrogenase complex dihydrolipoamide dehydrogenase (E3) component